MPGTPKNQVTYIAAENSTFFPNFGECWRYRDLVLMMALRDLSTRYKQTALGPLWIVLQPLINMVIFTVLLGHVAKLPSEGKPYALFAYAALLPWNLFSNIATSSAESLTSSRALLSKIYFPRLALPLSKLLSQGVDFAVNTLVLSVLLLAYRQPPSWALLLAPFYCAIAVALGLGCGLLVSGIAAKFRDVMQVVALTLRLWLYGTPVVYSLEIIPENWMWIARANPMAHVVTGFRAGWLGEAPPFPYSDLWWVTALAALVLMLGIRVFHESDYKVVDIA